MKTHTKEFRRISIAIGLLLYVSPAFALNAGKMPASLNLELSKDTLALAEPVYIEATITNNLEQDLLLDNLRMFGLMEHDRFSMTLINPSGEEWPYTGKTHYTRAPSTRLWLSVPPGVTLSQGEQFFWTLFVPSECRSALEKLPPGKYKLFATYQLPKQKGMGDVVVYSDTIEFVFLALNPGDRMQRAALIEMDSLRFFFEAGGSRAKVIPYLKRIMDSKTPYTEAAHALFISFIGSSTVNPDSFRVAKAEFDKIYAESQFAPVLVREQCFLSKDEEERDSLYNLLSEIEPTYSRVLLWQGAVKHPATMEEIK
jgi:hypothetical protein